MSEPASSPRGEPCAARKAPPATSDTSAQTFTAGRSAVVPLRATQVRRGIRGWLGDHARPCRRRPRCGVGRRRRGCGAKGDAVATRLVREAGRVLGASVADAVGLLNPAVIVIAGQLSATGEHLLAGIRERIYPGRCPWPCETCRSPQATSPGTPGCWDWPTGCWTDCSPEHLNAALASTG